MKELARELITPHFLSSDVPSHLSPSPRGSGSSSRRSWQSRTRPPAHQPLRRDPALLENSWSFWFVDIAIDPEDSMVDGILGERRLVVSHTDEMDVNDGRQQRVLQQHRSHDDAEHDDDFRVSHEPHGGVVVSWNT